MSCFRLVEELKGRFPVKMMCDLLDVSRSGFYEWRSREPSERQIVDQMLTELILEIHDDSEQTYGAPRIKAELADDHGISVGDWNTIASRLPGIPVAAKGPPHQRSNPDVGVSRPAIRCSSVDLPQPEGPRIDRNSPRRTSRSTGSSARVPFDQVLVALSTATAGGSARSRRGAEALRAGP